MKNVLENGGWWYVGDGVHYRKNGILRKEYPVVKSGVVYISITKRPTS